MIARLRNSSGKVVVSLAVVIALAVTAVGALAYFTSTGTGAGTANAGSLTAATISAPASSGSPVTITWALQATLADPGADSSITYTVMRKAAAGSYAAIPSGPCSGSLSYPQTSCGDNSVPSDATYSYEVVAHFRSWTATSSVVSVVVDTSPPTGGALTVNGQVATGAGTAGYNNTGSFTISAITDYTDGGSGLASSTLVRDQAPLSSSNGIAGGTCGTFASPTTISSRSTPIAQSLTGPTCYRYTLAGIDNAGNTASISTTVKVDTTAPSAPTVTPSTATGASTFISGSNVFINPQAGKSGGFTVGATSTDNDSGILNVIFPALTGFTSGGGTDTNSPYSTTYAWSGAGATGSGAQTVAATNNAALTNTGSFSVTPDTTQPINGALIVNGQTATSGGTSGYSSSTIFTIDTRTNYTDASSGIASSTLTVQSFALTSSGGIVDGTCGAASTPFSTPTTINGTTQPGGFITGRCYTYTLTGTDHVGNTVGISTTVKVDTTAPSAPVVTPSAATGNTFISGSNVFINPQAGFAGGFTAGATSTDNDSGILSMIFPALSGFTSGGGTDTVSPYSTVYAWSGAAATASGSQTATATNNASLTNTGSFTVTPDTDGPAGGGVLTVNGQSASAVGTTGYSKVTTFTIGTRTNYTDSGSGIASSTLTVQSFALSSSDGIAGGTCGTTPTTPFSTPTTITGTTQPVGIATGRCYTYTLIGIDNVGNVSAISTTVKVDTTAPSAPVVTPSAATGNTFISGSTVFINSQAGKSGGFTVGASSTDNDSGMLNMIFPALTGFTAGSNGGTDTISPYSTTYAWTGAVGAAGAQTVTATNNSTVTNTGTFTVTPDTAAPTGGGVLTVNGQSASTAGTSGYSKVTNFTIGTRTDYTDAGSGIASSILTVQSFALSSSDGVVGGTCGGTPTAPFSTPTLVSGTTQPSGIVTGLCYTYTLTGTDNVGNSSAVSTTVKVDTTVPTAPVVTPSAASGSTFISGSTVFINPQAGKSGGFTVGASSTDTDSGILNVIFPALTGFTAGSNGGTDTTSPYSTTYAWTGAVGATGSQTVTSTNNSTLTNTGAFTVTPDTAAPAGGGVLVVNGQGATTGGTTSSTSSTAFTIGTRTDYTDAGSGIATSTLTIQSTTLISGTCGAAGSAGPYTTATAITGTTNLAITAGFCYVYTLTGTDHVGNVAGIKTTVSVLTSPTVTAADAAGQGATNHDITVTGTGFVSGAGLAASISGVGVTVNATTFVSATQLTVNVSITAGAATGARNVTVTNPDGGAGTGTGVFTVNAGPTVSAPTTASPCNPGHNGTANCTITGTNFAVGVTVTISSNGAVNTVTRNSLTQITINVTGSGGNGAKGNLTVTNPDGGSVTVTNGFSNG